MKDFVTYYRKYSIDGFGLFPISWKILCVLTALVSAGAGCFWVLHGYLDSEIFLRSVLLLGIVWIVHTILIYLNYLIERCSK